MRAARTAILGGVLGLLAGAAAAQTSTAVTAPPPAPAPGWQFSLTPYGWVPALGGTIRTQLPRFGDRSFGLGSGNVLSDLDALPVMAMGEARYGRFAIGADFFYSALRQDIQTRDQLWNGGHARVISTMGTVLGTVRVVETPTQTFDGGIGTRIWSMKNKISLNPGIEPGVINKTSMSFADPIIAARYTARLSPAFGVTAYGDVGGFGFSSRLTWQAIGSFDYDLNRSTTLRVGWRYLSVDRGRSAVGADLSFNGPFVAATFRF
jgi:hypothetical protein